VASYLFVTFAAGGNSIALLRLARRLAERGHQIVLLGSKALEADAREHEIDKFVPMTRIRADIRDRETDPVRDWEARTQLGGMLRVTKWMFVDALPVAVDVSGEIAALKPDVVVVDAMLLGAIAAAEASKLPSATVMHGPWFLPTKGAVPFGLGRPPRRSVASTSLVWGARAMFDMLRAPVNRLRRDLGLPPVRHAVDQFLALERTLVLSSAAFDVPPTPLPRGVHYVGPELDRSSATYPVPDGDGPLVLAGFSTTYQGHESLIQRVIDALEALGVRGVVTTGPVDPGQFRVPPGVTVVSRAPHAFLLRSAQASVTHAGHGTVMESLRAGVPLLCIPISRDQPDVAARVVHRGCGLATSRHSSTEEIRSALGRVLQEPQLRQGAQDLSAAIRRDLEADQGIRQLEILASAKPTDG